ncbi:MSC_0619 family F1-like ATPase alpha subunit [Mycoplasmopsis pulmonis]|uniref:MSC_0619 family F1-like ATPase alpha subunit n=1 Tax=Mycoplasmopsis pulmonis TaxID=2107 RepID=UPI002ACE0EEC|nr:ATP F0F1 synthase subunit alpha [Mycoplasmopsis pulmonis]MDZ7293540.1 ATP F0F1 synthase subunit alpha [Mycoplasmopsis pulmonis]
MDNAKIVIKSIKDYIVEVQGDYDFRLYEVFQLTDDVKGFCLSVDEKRTFLLIDGDTSKIKVGTEIIPLESRFIAKTYKDYFGKVIDIDGKVLYSESEDQEISEKAYENENSAFKVASGIQDRVKLNEPLETGIFSIDILLPIGKGQRQLILGDSKTGKTSIALSTMINQKENDIKIIYVSIGLKSNDLKRIYKTIVEQKIAHKTILMHASSDNSFQQFLIPYVAMAHAENIMQSGEDVLIIFDDLTNHANVLREIALLTGKPVGKEAFPGDLFYSHSKLLERAGKFKNGYSITCFPIVRTINNDMTSLLASNIVSITDGQIVTNSEIKDQGILPAIDIGLSVSRTGSSVQSVSLSKIAIEISKIYSKYKQNKKFSDTNFDLNDSVRDIIKKGKILLKILNQKEFQAYSRSFNLIIAYIVVWGIFEDEEKIYDKLIYLYFVLRYDYIGKILVNVVDKKSGVDGMVDEGVLKAEIMRLLAHFKDIHNIKTKSYNDGKFNLSTRVLHKVKDRIWEK